MKVVKETLADSFPQQKATQRPSDDMTSIFTQFLSFNNDQERLQQFYRQMEKLSQQKESQKNDSSFDENQFLRHCADLRRQLDNYKRKIGGRKNISEQQENTIKNLRTLTDQLSSLMTSEKTSLASDSVKTFASKNVGEDEKAQSEETNSVEGIIEISSKDSSSDPDYAFDHSVIEGHDRIYDMNLREELENRENTVTENDRFVAVTNFKAQEKEDLTLKENELVRIIATRQDGWWLAENANGDRGFIPKTFLKVHKELIDFKEASKESGKPLPMPRRTVAAKTDRVANRRTIENEDISAKSKNTEGKNQRNDVNVGVIRDVIAPAATSNIGQDVETKILEESSSESSKVSGQDLKLSQPKIPKITHRRPLTQPAFVLDAFKRANDCSNHLTYECYLAPRLSKSNYAFHDIYWNYEDDRLRKRRVRVSKMIKVTRLDKVRLSAIDVHCRLVRAYLFDRKSTEEECQIVSNVYTIKAHPRKRDPQTWIFSTMKDMEKTLLNYPSFIVRSNYKQKSVTLCLEATIIFSDHEGVISEQSLGRVLLPIIDENGHCCIKNNSLPDVFLCHTLFLPMFFYYRRLLGQFLTKDRDNCGSTALKAEPFLATFPAIADQPDIMEMLWQLWKIHEKNVTNKKLSEMEEAERFRSFYLATGFIFHQTVAMPKFNWADVRCFLDRQTKLNHFREQYLHDFDAIKYLSRERCHPVDVYSCAVDIIGPHAVS
ncbi:hypothetical protein LOAG_04002 [Loa loa]|uniref:SH3 domain-containing protein n=1 Tax=Loa loa TaxID=7209 RepID=A0A1S0U514_LOALO|nr:hypothetical protein LOAG_04002 [Loa loa]EFO24488.2 hypothetical protein LOAG_04002 [Loa loa]